jgi:hypothetical protein
MLASEFFDERVRLRAQGKLPPGDPIVYDEKDTPQNQARFKAFNEYILHHGQKLDENLTESIKTEFLEKEDKGDFKAFDSNKKSREIKSHGVEDGDGRSVRRKLFINYTKDGKPSGDASTIRADQHEDCIDETMAALGQDEENGDTIVVDCGEGTEEELNGRRRSNMRQPTARQIQQKLIKISPKKKSVDGKEIAQGVQLHYG